MADDIHHGGSIDVRERPRRSDDGPLSFVSRSDHDLGTRWKPKYGGVIVAGTGFLLTRFVVLDAIQGQHMPSQFLLSGGLALVAGLGVIVAGIALTASTLPRSSVNRITRWYLVGVGGMALITGVGVLEAVLYGRVSSVVEVLASSATTNGLIGGAVGGLLVGGYSVRSAEYRRELSLNVDQVTLLNRVIRDKVLNKTNVIRANLELLETDGVEPSRIEAIRRSADRMEQAVADVGFLARTEPRAERSLGPVDLRETLERSIRRVRTDRPEVTFEVRAATQSAAAVLGNRHLETIFVRLFRHVTDDEGDGPGAVSVSIRPAERRVAVRVSRPGLSLTAAERDLLVEGILPQYDDPSVGFDLPIVRLLLSQNGGEIGIVDGDSSTGISIVLPRYTGRRREPTTGITAGVDLRQFSATALAAIAGGVAMGIVLWSLTDTLPAIGGLYGVQSLTIGWIIHLFHSVVFGILFVTIVEGPLFRLDRSPGSRVALGVGYGLLLWVVAAGFVMPVWLNAVGIDSSIPRLTLPSLVGHVVWGALLGGLYSLLANRRPVGSQ